MEDTDSALAKVNGIVQNHHELLSRPSYARVGPFLKITRQLIAEPEFAHNPNYEQLITDKLLTTNDEEEDLQSLAYFSWLKSKKLKNSFYQTLLQTATRNVFSFV